MAEIGSTKYNAGTIDTSVDGDTTDFTATIGKHYVIPYATGTPAANLVITLPVTPDIGNAVAFTMTTADATFHVDFVATINGIAYSSGGGFALIEAGDSVTFRYVNATVGWVVAANSIVGAYGSLSIEDGTTATTFGGASTDFTSKAQITVFDTDGSSLAMTPVNAQDHLVIRRTGEYQLFATVSFIGGSTDVYSLAFFKNNGATKLGSRTTRKIGSGATDTGACSVSALETLTAGDTIELFIQNETDTSDCTIQDCVFSAIQI